MTIEQCNHIELLLFYREVYERALEASVSFEESVNYEAELKQITVDLKGLGIVGVK